LAYGGAEGAEAQDTNTLFRVRVTDAVGTSPDEFQVDHGNVEVFWEFGTGADVINETIGDFIQSKRWNYLALVKKDNGGTFDLEVWHCSFGDFVIPVLRKTFTGLANSDGGASSSWFIGSDPDLSSFAFFDGRIDEIRVTGRALTPAEIQTSCSRVIL